MTEEQDKQFIEILLDRVKELTKDNFYLQLSNDSMQGQINRMESRLYSLSDDYARIRGRNLWHRILNTIP
jgi:hypothetical protein